MRIFFGLVFLVVTSVSHADNSLVTTSIDAHLRPISSQADGETLASVVEDREVQKTAKGVWDGATYGQWALSVGMSTGVALPLAVLGGLVSYWSHDLVYGVRTGWDDSETFYRP